MFGKSKSSGAANAWRSSAVLALSAFALVACQTATTEDTLNVGGDDKITEADLRAYCPRPSLLEGTAYLTTYTKGNDDNKDEVIYQATITDVTRTCKYRNGQLYMTVASAGRVVNGPKGTGGSITLPIRVAVKEGENLPYSQLGKIEVQVVPGAGATQFIYKDEQIVVAEPAAQNLQVIVGFDEGPYNTP